MQSALSGSLPGQPGQRQTVQPSQAHGGLGLTAHVRRSPTRGTSAHDRQQRSCRCQAQRDVDRETDRQRAPETALAPPIRVMPPPPPPPPPPPEDTGSILGPFGRRSSLFAIMVGGAALMSAIVRTRGPDLYSFKEAKDVMVTMTRDGNPVAVYEDEGGNTFMLDPNGNLYYDTGDPRLGIYFVDPEGTMLNIFIDGAGEPQYVPVGNIQDLRALDVSAIAGVPIEALQKAFGERAKTLYAFPSDMGVPMPDDAPAVIGKDGTVQPPPMLEEGALLLQEKRQWWPFGGGSDDDGGPFQRGY